MALIESESRANEIARDLVREVEECNGGLIDAGRLPKRHIEEARARFRAQVAPGLFDCFETILSTSRVARAALPTSRAIEPPPASTSIPGVPTSKSNRTIVLVASIVAAIPLVGFVVYAILSSPSMMPKLVTIPLPGLDRAGERSIKVAPGTKLMIGLRVGSYSYSGSPVIRLDVQLLDDGREVSRVRCQAWSFGGMFGGTGSGGGRIGYGADCRLAAPASGASTIRVTATRGGSGSLTVEDMEADVRVR